MYIVSMETAHQIAPKPGLYYRFANFCFRPDRGLFQHDRLIPLPPKEMQLLQLLLESHEDTVSHRIIEENLWPKQIVSYDSITRCVYSLRKTLRDAGVECVATLPKRGYRITIAVQAIGAGVHASSRADAAGTESALAYSHYSAARREADYPRPERLAFAAELLEQAVKADSGYTAAFAAIADVRMYQCVRGYLSPTEAYQSAKKHCRAALRINDLHVPSSVALAWFDGIIGRQLETGLSQLDRALKINTDYAPAYAYRSWFMRAMGDSGAAVRDQEIGVSLDPHALLNRHGLSICQFHNGQCYEAAQTERHLAAIYPNDDISHAYLALFTAYLGEKEEALRAASRALELSGDIPAVAAVIAYVEAAVGSREKAEKILRFVLDSTQNRAPGAIVAPALLELGRDDEARELLREGNRIHCPWNLGARTDPRLQSVAADAHSVL